MKMLHIIQISFIKHSKVKEKKQTDYISKRV